MQRGVRVGGASSVELVPFSSRLPDDPPLPGSKDSMEDFCLGLSYCQLFAVRSVSENTVDEKPVSRAEQRCRTSSTCRELIKCRLGPNDTSDYYRTFLSFTDPTTVTLVNAPQAFQTTHAAVSHIAAVVPASTKGRCEARPTGRVRIDTGFGEDGTVTGWKGWKELEFGKRVEREGGKGVGRIGRPSEREEDQKEAGEVS